MFFIDVRSSVSDRMKILDEKKTDDMLIEYLKRFAIAFSSVILLFASQSVTR
jgi:hypothetical protein